MALRERKVDRAVLRRRIAKLHTKFDPQQLDWGMKCAWCKDGFGLMEEWHLHEAFVKRNAVPLLHQHLIFTEENCVPLHARCHMNWGQSREMVARCLDHMIEVMGAARIARWYVDLWRVHGLHLPKGPETVAWQPGQEGWEEYLRSVL